MDNEKNENRKIKKEKTKKKKEFKVFSRKQPVFSFVKKILRLFYKKPQVVYLAGPIPDKSIIVANHVSKKGVVIYELYLPVFHACWGAHEMLENYSSRFHYLRDVYYIQKKGCGKFSSTIRAGFEAIFSIYLYKGLKFIPTYTDARLMRTINDSGKVLDSGTSVLIFPENSNEGYKDVLTEFFPGFVMLSEQYYKKTGEDLPVYPVYYHSDNRKLIVGEPKYIQEYVNSGLDRKQIAEEFRQMVNGLYFKHILGEDGAAAD